MSFLIFWTIKSDIPPLLQLEIEEEKKAAVFPPRFKPKFVLSDVEVTWHWFLHVDKGPACQSSVSSSFFSLQYFL